MSAGESGPRGEVRQAAGGGRSRPVAEAFAWIAYLAGASGVLLFGSGDFAVAPIAGYGLMLAVAACLCRAAAGRMMLGIIATFIILGLCFYIGQDPQGTMQSIADSYLGSTYFGMWRQ